MCCHMQTHAARERVYLFPTQMLHATPTRCSAANPRGLFTACHNMITIILCIFQKMLCIFGVTHSDSSNNNERKTIQAASGNGIDYRRYGNRYRASLFRLHLLLLPLSAAFYLLACHFAVCRVAFCLF